jgi:lysophospholipase L1-like esterase
LKKSLFAILFMLLSAASAWATERGVQIGDSFTASGQSIAKVLTDSYITSLVNSGKSGDTLAGMAARVTADAIDAYTGPNLVTNGEFVSAITGWTKLSASGSIAWEPTYKKLELTNDLDTYNCSVYSTAITTTQNTAYELSMIFATLGTVSNLNIWVGVTGNPFNNTVLGTTGATRPFHHTFTTGTGVTTIYVGFQNVGGVVGQFSAIGSVGVRAYAKPTFIVVQGGINDIVGGASLSDMQANVVTIMGLIKAAGIFPVFWNVGPAAGTVPHKDLIDSYNAWLKTYCDAQGASYIDAYAALVDPAVPRALNPVYDSGDGIHPNTAGYEAVVAPDGVVQTQWYHRNYTSSYNLCNIK